MHLCITVGLALRGNTDFGSRILASIVSALRTHIPRMKKVSYLVKSEHDITIWIFDMRSIILN